MVNKIPVFIFLTGNFLCQLNGFAQNIDSLKSGVVLIRGYEKRNGKLQEPESEKGAGIVIHKNDEELYILTAWHILHKGDDDDMRKKEEVKLNRWDSLTVEFKDDVTKKFGAKEIFLRSVLDIAVLSVQKNINNKFPKFSVRIEDVEEGEINISGIGHNPTISLKWGLFKKSEILIKNFKEDERRFLCTDESPMGQGFSGGPVFDKNNRLIGIFSEMINEGSIIVKMKSVLSVFENIHVPHNLLIPYKPESSGDIGGGAKSQERALKKIRKVFINKYTKKTKTVFINKYTTNKVTIYAVGVGGALGLIIHNNWEGFYCGFPLTDCEDPFGSPPDDPQTPK